MEERVRVGNACEICFQRLILPALSPFNLSVLALAGFGFSDLISQSEYVKTLPTVLV